MARVLATHRTLATHRVLSLTRVLRGAPNQPIGLTPSPGNGTVALNWTVDLRAATYNIYRGTVSGGELTVPLATGVTGTTYTDNAVSNGTTYFYIIRALATGGQISLPSLEVSATPTGAAPSGNYAAENGTDLYVAENTTDNYVTET